MKRMKRQTKLGGVEYNQQLSKESCSPPATAADALELELVQMQAGIVDLGLGQL